MKRMGLGFAFAVVFLLLATSSNVNAWYTYHYGGYRGNSFHYFGRSYSGYHYGGYHYGGSGGYHYGYSRRY